MMIIIKGTLSIISNDPPCKDCNAWFTKVLMQGNITSPINSFKTNIAYLFSGLQSSNCLIEDLSQNYF